jgi:deoxyribonuclease-4
MPKIGAHVSVAGGLANGIEKAKAIGAECIQIFGSSPRQWRVRIPSEENIQAYKKAQKSSGIEPVFLHSAYLVNLACPDSLIYEYSVASLSGHLSIAESIGAQGLIFHVGSGKELPKREALAQVIRGMRTVLEKVPGKAELIIENSAGGGRKLASTADDIRALLHGVGSPRVKVCIDTAHLFEAGVLDFKKESVERVLSEWDGEIGFENVVAIHANDSKTIFGSFHDRHENIGEGHIGIEGFKNFVSDSRVREKPFIIETPGFDNLGPDKRNIDTLRACF